MDDKMQLLMGLGMSEGKASFALHKFNGDIGQASDWSFGDGSDWTSPLPLPPSLSSQFPAGTQNLHALPAADSAPSGISSGSSVRSDHDLEYARAIAASLETRLPTSLAASTSSFGDTAATAFTADTLAPSPKAQSITRLSVEPHTSGQGSDLSLSVHDNDLRRAMEESLSTSQEVNPLNALPESHLSRPTEAPVAFFSPTIARDFEAAVLQAFEAVPQIRSALYAVGVTLDEASNHNSSEAFLLWNLYQLFGLAENTTNSFINLSSSMIARPEGYVTRSPPDAVAALTEWINEAWKITAKEAHFESSTVASDVARILTNSSKVASLFESTGGPIPPAVDDDIASRSLISLSCGPETKTVTSGLAAAFWAEGEEQGALYEPAEVLIFRINYPHLSGPRVRFEMEESFFVDRFLQGNSLTVAQLRAELGVLRGQEEELRCRIEQMTTVKAKDVSETLRQVSEYYEKIARASKSEHEAKISSAREKLGKLRHDHQAALKSMTDSKERITKDIENVFEIPELKKCRYDLRAILHHDGLYGSGSVYSYVKSTSDSQAWFKVSSGVAQQVTAEQALGDSSGLHLGAGPFLLCYSRSVEHPWPESLPSFSEAQESRSGSQRNSMVDTTVGETHSPSMADTKEADLLEVEPQAMGAQEELRSGVDI